MKAGKVKLEDLKKCSSYKDAVGLDGEPSQFELQYTVPGFSSLSLSSRDTGSSSFQCSMTWYGKKCRESYSECTKKSKNYAMKFLPKTLDVSGSKIGREVVVCDSHDIACCETRFLRFKGASYCPRTLCPSIPANMAEEEVTRLLEQQHTRPSTCKYDSTGCFSISIENKQSTQTWPTTTTNTNNNHNKPSFQTYKHILFGFSPCHQHTRCKWWRWVHNEVVWSAWLTSAATDRSCMECVVLHASFPVSCSRCFQFSVLCCHKMVHHCCADVALLSSTACDCC